MTLESLIDMSDAIRILPDTLILSSSMVTVYLIAHLGRIKRVTQLVVFIRTTGLVSTKSGLASSCLAVLGPS